jgi:hypothetical protein
VTGAFAEFERSMIRQRVNAGLKRAVEAGKTLGRALWTHTLFGVFLPPESEVFGSIRLVATLRNLE